MESSDFILISAYFGVYGSDKSDLKDNNQNTD